MKVRFLEQFEREKSRTEDAPRNNYNNQTINYFKNSKEKNTLKKKKIHAKQLFCSIKKSIYILTHK